MSLSRFRNVRETASDADGRDFPRFDALCSDGGGHVLPDRRDEQCFGFQLHRYLHEQRRRERHDGLFGRRKGVALLGHRRGDLDRDSAHHNNDNHVRDKEHVYGFLFGLRNSDDAHALGTDLELRIGFYDAYFTGKFT
ncbi:hypothetical protein L596_029191 [Steinernema carpocapsae]|uniref:Uncharacterized protein n=1 Tax=Steinernema carpocapsae TaxID=34508 RepID=A0A4V5ZXM3_STECR|nr:hypothetical protein L596_029191 [Steinernema carpocapsae]